MLTLEAMNRRKFSSSTISLDVRVFFAAERTLLAWVRTGLTVMALGFVVARFGLFLTLLTAGAGALGEANSHWLSGALGILLVLIGSIVVIGGLHNHTRYIAALPPEALPKMAIPWLSSFLAYSVGLVGVSLSIYLIFT